MKPKHPGEFINSLLKSLDLERKYDREQCVVPINVVRELMNVINSISFKNLAIPLHIQMDPLNGTIVARMKVFERDSGEPTEVIQQRPIDPRWYLNQIFDNVIETCVDLIRHELQETFHYKGHRVMDPHRREMR